LKIRDHVEVLSQPTVVRLEHLQMANAGWISANYYITEETGKHFKALRSLFAKENGCGAFLIGHYGSGKSHFLAYLTQQIQSGAITEVDGIKLNKWRTVEVNKASLATSSRVGA